MKVIRGKFRLFRYGELSETAKEKAFEDWVNMSSDFVYDTVSDDISRTLDAFEKIFDVNITLDSYSGELYLEGITFKGVWADNNADDFLCGERLRRFIINNFYPYLVKGKYYVTKGKRVNGRYTYKCRYSKVMMTRDCVLTGVYYDDVFLRPLYDFIDGRTVNDYENAYYLLKECAKSLIEAAKDEVKYRLSEEYFLEEENRDDYYFFEDGGRYCRPEHFIPDEEVEFIEDDKNKRVHGRSPLICKKGEELNLSTLVKTRTQGWVYVTTVNADDGGYETFVRPTVATGEGFSAKLKGGACLERKFYLTSSEAREGHGNTVAVWERK